MGCIGKVHSAQAWHFVVVVVRSLSCVSLSANPWTAASQASLAFTISWSLFKFMSIESVMLSNHLILCQPLLFLPSIFPSIRVFSNESVLCIKWPKYWSSSFSISPSSECSGLISFRMDWLDLLAIPGTLKSLLECVHVYMRECSLSGVGLFATLWTVACQTSLFHGISQARILKTVAISSSRGST